MIKHLACIMDGNRRWAKRRGWFPWLGHRQGVDAVRAAVDFCLKNNIPFLSLYTFSIENFKRSVREKSFLFNLMIRTIEKERKTLIERGIKVRFLGDRTLFPENVRCACDQLEQETASLTNLNLNLLFCYGARQEIVSGIKGVIKQVKAGLVTEDDITVDTVFDHLWTGSLPDPDLIVRTGGVRRLSNFLLYQAAYSELCFLDCLWPELTEEHLEGAVKEFEQCKRNFGT